MDSLEVDCQCAMLMRNNGSGSVPIQRGSAKYTGTSIGSLATYQCEEGYLLAGNSQRICQSNGHWNGSTPECQRIENNSS